MALVIFQEFHSTCRLFVSISKEEPSYGAMGPFLSKKGQRPLATGFSSVLFLVTSFVLYMSTTQKTTQVYIPARRFRQIFQQLSFFETRAVSLLERRSVLAA